MRLLINVLLAGVFGVGMWLGNSGIDLWVAALILVPCVAWAAQFLLFVHTSVWSALLFWGFASLIYWPIAIGVALLGGALLLARLNDWADQQGAAVMPSDLDNSLDDEWGVQHRHLENPSGLHATMFTQDGISPAHSSDDHSIGLIGSSQRDNWISLAPGLDISEAPLSMGMTPGSDDVMRPL